MARSDYADGVVISSNPMTRLNTTDANKRNITVVASTPHRLSRYHGGHRRDNHPYVSGYWYFLIQPPERMFLEKDADSSKNIARSVTWLHTTAESFTPPGKTLTFVDVPGMGGLNTSYVAGQELTSTFQVTFREYQELPIFNIFQTWTAVIDPNTGVSPLSGDEYIPANYKGSAYAALCKPTIGDRPADNLVDNTGSKGAILRSEDIEQIFYFDGVFPETTPLDFMDSDISSNESKTISITFSFDGYPLLKDSSGVVRNFLSLVNAYDINSTYRHYNDDIQQSYASLSKNYRGTE